jgi:hypothetical protein
MISAPTLRLIGLAIAGVLVAAAVAVLASQLASRQIGLASEPISAGDELAPAIVRPHRGQGNEGGGTGTTPAEPRTESTGSPPASGTEATTTPTTGGGEETTGHEDSGGSRSGAGGGDGSAHGDD